MNATGILIRTKRTELSLSQTALAKRLRVSSAFINKVETGKGRWPRKRIRQLCQALSIKRDKLVNAMILDYYQ